MTTIYLQKQQLEQERSARKAAEALFHNFTNTVPNIIYILDLEENSCAYINNQIEAELGYTAEDIATMGGHVFSTILIPEDQPSLVKNIALLEQTEDGKVLKAEYRVRDKQRNLKYLYCREKVYMRNERGQVKQIIGAAEDVTGLRKSKRALQQQKSFYEAILNSLTSKVAVFDDSLRYQFLNPAAIGEPSLREWMMGKTVQDYRQLKSSHLEFSPDWERHLNTLLEEKKFIEFEEKIIDRQGREFFHLHRLNPVFNEQNEVKQVISHSVDSTEKRQAMETLTKSEKKFKDLVNFSPAIIFTHDLEGHILSVNPSFCRMIGCQEGELVGQHINSFAVKGDRNRFECYLQDVKHNQLVEGEFTALNRKKEEVSLFYTSYLVEEAGTVPFVVCNAQDITERVLMERDLNKAKELAEESVQIKERFLANMSHEIRTPINGIMGISNLMAKTQLDAVQQHYVKVISQSIDNLMFVINDILDLEKINAGKLQFEETQFDLNDSLKAVHHALKYKAEEKEISLKLMPLALEQPFLKGDPYRLNQILLNLVSNAIKFTEEGEVSLTCEVLEESAREVNLQFMVADTGIGIPEDKREKIFEEFTQAYTSTTRTFGGTGLGLNICKQLVELQGGQIWVDSNEGNGSVFKFVLRYQKFLEPMVGTGKEEEINFNSLGKVRVLLAEDNEINILLTQTILENWGMAVEVVQDGKEAVERVAEYDFDVILMDIQMPVMNGMDATKLIRGYTDTKKAATPIIALTANVFKGDTEKYLSAGMNGSVSKPFREEELYREIRGCLPEKLLTEAPQAGKAGLQRHSDTADIGSGEALKVCNLRYLEEMAAGDKGFIMEMVNLFLRQAPGELEILKVAVKSGNKSEIKIVAHKFKSSLSMVGAEACGANIRQIEELTSKKDGLTEIRKLLPKVTAQCESVFEELTAVFPIYTEA